MIFLIPAMYIVPSLFVRWGGDGLTGVWASCTICDFLGTVLAMALLLTQLDVFRPGYVPKERRPRKEATPRETEKRDEAPGSPTGTASLK